MNAGQTLELHPQFDRRSLFRQAAGGVAAAIATTAAPVKRSYAMAAALTGPAEFKAQLRGAVLSIGTPFTEDLAIDYAGVERMIKRALPHGIRIFSLTSGNSQYASLKYEEIVDLTRAMIEAAGPDAVTIAAADDWNAEKVIEYAGIAEDASATALQVMRPKDVDDAQAVKFFQEIAGGSRLPIVLHGEFSKQLLEKLATVSSIVALKEDVGLEYYIQTQRKFGDRYAIFEGGPEYAYLVARPYGSPASYTTLGTFAPQLTRQFWDAIHREDISEAYRLVIKYEHPFFDRWSHEFWRATLQHFGVASRYMRPPFTSFNNEQMKGVAKFYKDLGLS